MKNYIITFSLLILGTVVFQSCGKDLGGEAPDIISIEDYIAQNNISPEYTASGVGYVINTAGNTRRANGFSTVKADVTVKTTDNTLRIDTQGESLFNLFGQVPGFKEGLQLVGEGGSITLYAPFENAWGADGNISVPGAADVIIDISMSDILIDIETYIEENNIMLSDTTDAGVFVLIEEEGDGTFPDIGNSVTVKYSGYYSNGDVFDSSDTGIQIGLSQVIQGWQEGIQLFSKGGKGKLFIPFESGYGTNGSRDIPGYTDLIFDIELVDFE